MRFAFPPHPSRAWGFSHNGVGRIWPLTGMGLTWCWERTGLLGEDGGCRRVKRHQALWVDSCWIFLRGRKFSGRYTCIGALYYLASDLAFLGARVFLSNMQVKPKQFWLPDGKVTAMHLVVYLSILFDLFFLKFIYFVFSYINIDCW